MAKFRNLAANFGEIVQYENDKGARDIGLHLTEKRKSGSERVTAALIWFQMKGVMKETLPQEKYERAEFVRVRLMTAHLKFWFLQPMSTYLVVYVESVDQFLILNLQRYVEDRWGRDILYLEQETAIVEVSKDSPLDEQAFSLLLERSNLDEWKRALDAKDEEVRLCIRDYNLVWHFGTADVRDAEHQIIFWDWQSKTRAQLFIQERLIEAGSEWVTLREHWQHMSNVDDLQDMYTYLDFFADDECEGELSWDEGEDSPFIQLELQNGQAVYGEDCGGEFISYEFGVRLNDLGQRIFEQVQVLERIGLIELKEGSGEFVSTAPWHARDV
ncbi:MULTISPECIES: DUF4365 domain-containing protein [unclassified Halomonas]|uniref:DUF4365 domain-containing protein n=1 Tax=unclassified Halomonas TaxID=2609666 RepID=UPI002883B0D4|nr:MULTISPECIES: DUF4365 domain-containing protein [unclassified Halomonas]MDT0501760.1 DUF4365 domain-containing protein [Halomonas sp. PAR7]MDT0513410.1 DUF4365 domain-containing protein [Halomonas sp. LES1]MDT0591823.1 DUF4365 domain-containing protein [Halomonas sp. PAR8]